MQQVSFHNVDVIEWKMMSIVVLNENKLPNLFHSFVLFRANIL